MASFCPRDNLVDRGDSDEENWMSSSDEEDSFEEGSVDDDDSSEEDIDHPGKRSS